MEDFVNAERARHGNRLETIPGFVRGEVPARLPDGGQLGRGMEKGHHHKLTPTVKSILVEVTRKGNYPSVAARKAGITYATLRAWLEKGRVVQEAIEAGECEPGDGKRTPSEYELADLFLRMAEADAEAEANAVDQVTSADSWQAHMTFLERRHPDRWRKRETTEVVGQGGGPLEVAQIDNTPERIAEVAGLLAGLGLLPSAEQPALPPGEPADAGVEPVHPARPDP